MNSYTEVWRAGSHRHYLWANVTWSSFCSKWEENSPRSLRLVDMNVHLVDRDPSFSAQADDLDGSGGGDGSRDIMLGDAASADAHGAEPSEGTGFGGGEW